MNKHDVLGSDSRHTARLVPLCAALALCAMMQGTFAANAPLAATVTYVTGNVTIQPARGAAGVAPRAAAKGSEIASGESIDTGKGQVQLRMVDGAMISLQADTTLLLDDYHLAGDGKEERGFMNLVKGGLRQVSGTIGKTRQSDYKLETPLGLIGIRGTEFTVDVGAGLKVGVIGGQVNVCSTGGCVDVFKGQTSFTPSIGARPEIRASAPMIVPPPAPVVASIYNAGEQVRSMLQDTAAPAPAATPAPAPAPADTATPDPVTITPAPAPGSTVATPAPAPVVASPSPAPVASPSPSTSPAPSPVAATPAPSPVAGSPAPTPAPSPVAAAPSPSPAPAPVAAPPVTASTPTTGPVTFGAAWVTTAAAVSSVQTTGTATYDNSGMLTELRADGPGGNKFKNGTSVESRSDGVVSWGRWMNGKSDFDLKGDLSVMHYFAFTGTPTVPVVKAFTSFASTAPTITNALGITQVAGASNSATGTLNVNFTGPQGGSVTYALLVPTTLTTFQLTGTATQSGTFGFTGGGVVTSSLLGVGCLLSCSGALPGGATVQGAVGGTGNTRAGLDYGFNSLLGKVTGVIVFKPKP